MSQHTPNELTVIFRRDHDLLTRLKTQDAHYARLAEGEADVAVFWSPRLWDHAPGSLLLAETGGVVAGLRRAYEVRDRRPRLLLAAGDRSAYEAVRGRRV